LNAGTTLTVASSVASNGVLSKTGPGVLVLNNLSNQYPGGLTISGGRIDVSDEAQLGAANPTVNALGTLRYTASATTARAFNLLNGTLEAPTGVTLTLNGASVGGGFLRGLGTFALTGNSALAGVTTFTTTNLNVTGTASATNFSNNGTVTIASGQSFAMNYATNGSAGLVTINGTANVGDFVSNGRLAVNPGGTLNNTQGTITFGGGSVTTIGIYNPSNGQVTPGGTIDIG